MYSEHAAAEEDAVRYLSAAPEQKRDNPVLYFVQFYVTIYITRLVGSITSTSPE